MAVRSWMNLLVIFLIIATMLLEIQVQHLKYDARHSERNFERQLPEGVSLSRSTSTKSSNLPIVLYNRLPKTGSTSFTNLLYDSSKRNQLYVIHINTTKNSHIMSVQDQYNLVQNMTMWNEMRPVIYHGHMAYVDFKHFGSAIAPLYINIIRDPLERLISYYYFLRYGDDYRKGLKRARQGDKTTFDECTKMKGADCAVEKLWLQIPFFCGQAAECWKPGSEWALQEAKNNLVNNYMLVGLTEQMEEFVTVLEAILPEMLKGVTEMYRVGSKSHIRKTLHKEMPSTETREYFENSKIWQMEMELYLFGKEQFEYVKKQSTILDSTTGRLRPLKSQFRYEKIYGPNGIIRK